MSDELRAELAKKAKKAGIKVPDEWGVAEIETALGVKALEDEAAAKAAAEAKEAAAKAAADKAEADKAAEEKAAADKAAAEEAAKPPPIPAGYAQVRITKHGHGKVFTGSPDNATYSMDAIVLLPVEVAKALEARAYAEIR